MHRKFFFLSLAALFIVFALILGNIFYVSAKDFTTYRNMIENFTNFEENYSLTNHLKKNVRKDLYFRSSNQNAHHRLSCERSNLLLMQNGSSLEIYEVMKNINGQIEEKEGMESAVRYFQAENGVYQYTDQIFTAPEISFICQSDEQAPAILGAAKNVRIYFNNAFSHLEADNLCAKIKDPRGNPGP